MGNSQWPMATRYLEPQLNSGEVGRVKSEGRRSKAEGRLKSETRKVRCWFVTGTDTGVGKTFVTAAILRALRKAGVHAGAAKPFATGNRDDARVLRAAMDGELTLEEINPVFFRRPLAPMVAASPDSNKSRWSVLNDHKFVRVIQGVDNLLQITLLSQSAGRTYHNTLAAVNAT